MKIINTISNTIRSWFGTSLNKTFLNIIGNIDEVCTKHNLSWVYADITQIHPPLDYRCSYLPDIGFDVGYILYTSIYHSLCIKAH